MWFAKFLCCPVSSNRKKAILLHVATFYMWSVEMSICRVEDPVEILFEASESIFSNNTSVRGSCFVCSVFSMHK